MQRTKKPASTRKVAAIKATYTKLVVKKDGKKT